MWCQVTSIDVTEFLYLFIFGNEIKLANVMSFRKKGHHVASAPIDEVDPNVLRFQAGSNIFLESLILAQDERWRRA